MIEPPSGEEMLRITRGIFLEEGGMNPILLYNSGEQVCITPCEEHHPAFMMAGIQAGVVLGKLERPDWIAIATDSYYAVMKNQAEVRDHEHEGVSLGERFKAGDPMVGESLMVQCISKVGVLFCIRQGYIRDGDKFVWDDPEDLNDQGGNWDGRMVQAMQLLLGLEGEL